MLPWKATPGPVAEVLAEQRVQVGATVKVGDVVGKITVTVTLNMPVDPSTVVAGTSVVLGGQRMPNAAGSATVNGSQLVFTTNATWDQIVGPGGPDTAFTLTLKAAVRAADGGQMQQCKTGNATPGAEPLGDCVLTFVIPG